MTYIFENNAASTLAATCTLTDTSLTVAAGEGARFPSPGAGQSFLMTIQAASAVEIVEVTGRSGDVFTISRAKEGTAAQTWSAGASVTNRITALALNTMVQPSYLTDLLDAMFVGCSFDFNGAEADIPANFLVCAGQEVSRTVYAKLFAKIGTAHGAGDGSTTFNLPDYRGRVSAGKDDMGGSDAARLTSVLSSLTLGATGGNQNLQQHLHSTVSHSHSLNDPGHAHTGGDFGHGHSVNDPGHNHGFSNALVSAFGGIGFATYAGGGAPLYYITETFPQGTGVTVNTGYANIGINGNYTGLSVNAAAPDTNNAGTGNAQNVQPTIISNKIIFIGF